MWVRCARAALERRVETEPAGELPQMKLNRPVRAVLGSQNLWVNQLP